MIHREQLRKIISDAYYETRDRGGNMEDAADAATEDVMQRLTEEPGLTAMITWGTSGCVGIVAEHPQAEPQATPTEAGRHAEAMVSHAADQLPAEARASRMFTGVPADPAEFKPGEVISRFRPLP